MRFEQSFLVKAPADRVWAFLADPRRTAACLPGAEITEQVDETTYAGTLTVKVGPVSARYRGTVRFEKLDAVHRSAEIVASGLDVGGKGSAEMRMSSRLVERAGGETEVTVTSDLNLTGILAQFGRGMIQEVSNQMFRRFTEAVRTALEAPAAAAAPAPAEPIEAVSFGTRVAGRLLSRTARRPAFWAVAALVGLAIYWLWLR